MPFAEIGNMRSESQVCLNPGTKLFEVAVFRGDGPDLIIRNLPLPIAERLREAIIDALRERHT